LTSPTASAEKHNLWKKRRLIFAGLFRPLLKALSNKIAPNPIIFFVRENFPPIFRKGSVVFWARNKNKQTWPPDLKMKIVKYLCHPGLDSF
jgi:hypothetical protein